MAAIKSYTDIEQSKKLAEILPIESADMEYILEQWIDENTHRHKEEYYEFPVVKVNDDSPLQSITHPCWSLAALLDLLPNEIITDNRLECHYQIHIRKYDSGSNTTLYQIAYGNNRGSSGSWHDMVNTGEKEHLIDACFQMLINLNELKLL